MGLDRGIEERVVMLGAKKEQLETGSGVHKIERIRLATGVADPRLQKRDLKRRRRRSQRFDHLRAAASGLFNIHGCSGCRSDQTRVLYCLVNLRTAPWRERRCPTL